MYALKLLLISIIILLSFSCSTKHDRQHNNVKVVGAMRDVMWKGELQGKITLDTISPKEGLYGLGPVSGLSGELIILDVNIYMANVASDASMNAFISSSASAPDLYWLNFDDLQTPELLNYS